MESIMEEFYTKLSRSSIFRTLPAELSVGMYSMKAGTVLGPDHPSISADLLRADGNRLHESAHDFILTGGEFLTSGRFHEREVI